MQTATLIVAALGLAVSTTTLVIVVVGGKKVQERVELGRTKANESLSKLRAALDGVEL